MDPGLETMMALVKRQRMRARLPLVEAVAQALREFFAAKLEQKKPLEDNQAQLVLQSVQYCLQREDVVSGRAEDNQMLLLPTDLETALKALSIDSTSFTAAHVALAGILFDALRSSKDARAVEKGLVSYVKVLSATGSASKARDILLLEEQRLDFTESKAAHQNVLDDEQVNYSPYGDHRPTRDSLAIPDTVGDTCKVLSWLAVLDGFARERNNSEVYATFKMCRERRLPGRRISEAMLDFSIADNDMRQIEWFWPQVRPVDAQLARPLSNVLNWCIENGHIHKGDDIVASVTNGSPPKAVWDVIFTWAAGTGKGPDEINRMIGVMEKMHEPLLGSTDPRVADSTTINSLVAFAVSKNDPYMAERFISIGRERGIEPDARTYTLQMDYRLSVADIDGALIAYKNLQSLDSSSEHNAASANRLVVALCSSKRHDFDTTMNVVGDMTDRRLRFEADTVTALCLLHLRRNEIDDVTDLLNTHSFHFSSFERDSIREHILAFAVDARVTTSRAWMAYVVLQSVFDEMPRAQRTEIMTSFFRRGRTDMGVQVFQHMRQHSRADTMPTVDTYVTAFIEIARLRNLDNLEVVHNQLKLDFNVDPTTYLRNALIIAYTKCDEARKALNFWDDIVSSREGPSFNSIHAALRACEKSPFGDLEAQKIWDLLRRRKIELDQSLWASYAGALAGNGDNDTAIGILEQAVKNGEVVMDAFIIGSLFNGSSGQIKQKEIEDWAKANYSGLWDDLVNVGVKEDENFMRQVNIDRRIGP